MVLIIVLQQNKGLIKTHLASITLGFTKQNKCYQQPELTFPGHYLPQDFGTKVSYPFVPF